VENLNQELLILFKKNKGFIDENLIIAKDINNGFGIFAKNSIPEGKILIDVPFNLLIPVNEINNLNKFRNKFEEVFFTIQSENLYNLENHPLNSNDFELEKINNAIRNNQNLSKNFIKKIETYNLLSKDEKIIDLLSSTRAINLKEYDKKFFMPVMDFVNYKYNGLQYLIGKNKNLYIKSKKDIKKGEEIFINYTYSSDSISFFLKHGFIDDSFNSFRIKKNELKIKLNSIATFNKNYFLNENHEYTFKESLYFFNNTFSKNLKNFLEIFPANKRLDFLKKILNMYKNSVIIDEEQIDKKSILLKNFYKSIKIYKNIIDNYLNIIEKNEKN